jgi:hypothetical protein
MDIDSIYNEITLWHDKREYPEHGRQILVRSSAGKSSGYNFYIGRFQSTAFVKVISVCLPDNNDVTKQYLTNLNYDIMTDKWAYLDDIIELIL